jgi:hypothetical protein
MTEATPKMDDILDKLEKVQALQNGAATPAEAEAAATAMTRLLAKYNLDALDVQRRLGAKAPALVFAKEDVKNIGNTPWKRALLNAVARHNQCRMVYYTGTKDAVLFGPESTIRLVIDLFTSLERVVSNLTALAYQGVTVLKIPGTTWRAAYALGCVTGIGVAMERAKQDVIAHTDGGSALVLVNDAALDSEVERQLGKLSAPTKISYDQHAYAQGFYDGIEVNVASRGDLKG